MLRSIQLLFVAAPMFFTSLATAQCPGCMADLTCTTSPAFPTLCPAQPPAATAGEEYQADLTFWMPASFDDPGSGLTLDLQQMTVTGISGLPLGLSIETNDPAGTYFPQQNEFGCARLCGTPITAGYYNITISVLATVALGGFTTQVPEEFILLLNVQPGTGGNTSFSFSPTSGCGSVTASFTALIDGSPSPTSYNWDFGNGNTSSEQLPPAQLFDTPGAHVVTLETTIGGHVLDNVTITGVNDNWCGDVEEPNIPFVGCTGSPDLYFVLSDANGSTYSSTTFDDTFTATWSNLAVLLDNPPYSIAIYDEDPVSQNDLLGTYNIPTNGTGTYYINVAGGTTGSLDISLSTQQTFIDTDTIIVHPLPEVEILQNENELCASDPGLIGYLWLLNGDTLTTNDPCIVEPAPGTYQLIGISAAGCQGTSGPMVICPQITISQNGNVLSVPAGFTSYQWSYNGEPIIDANNSFLIIEADGTYSVIAETVDGCIITATLELAVGMEEDVLAGFKASVFPNPNNGTFTITAGGLSGSSVQVSLFDPQGKIHLEQKAALVNGNLRMAIFTSPGPGIYFIRISDLQRSLVRQVIIH